MSTPQNIAMEKLYKCKTENYFSVTITFYNIFVAGMKFIYVILFINLPTLKQNSLITHSLTNLKQNSLLF